MHSKTYRKGIFFLLGCAALAVILGNCRRTEPSAVESAESTPIESDQMLDSSDQAAVDSPEASSEIESVTPVPYRAPVVVEPTVSAAQTRDTPPARPEMAQYPQAAPRSEPPPRPTPVLVTVPAGTLLRVRIDDHLSSHSSQVGQQFSGTITQDVAAEGRVAIRQGATVIGRVTEAEPAKKIGGRARLSLDFESIELGAGQTRPMSARFAQAGKSQTAKDAAIIGGSTIGGAIIGEAIEDGEGKVIGAIVGGLGGAYAAKKTKAKPVEVPVGTLLDLELTEPITLEIFPG